MSLPKKERALCLFNNEVLRGKVRDARVVLESEGDDEPVPQPKAQPSTPKKDKEKEKEKEPTASSTPPLQPITLSSLSHLPASEILRRLPSLALTPPLPTPDPLVVSSTDSFIDSLLSKSQQTQKQLLGEKLFKVVKSFGVKSAPKVTVALLDQEDLRALAHLMNEYPGVLKEKVLGMVQQQQQQVK